MGTSKEQGTVVTRSISWHVNQGDDYYKVADETQSIDDALSAWLYEHDDGVTDQDAVDIADSIHEHLSSAVELAATLE